METIYDHVDKKTADEFMRKYLPMWLKEFSRYTQQNHYVVIMVYYRNTGNLVKAQEYFNKLSPGYQYLFKKYLDFPIEKAFKIRT